MDKNKRKEIDAFNQKTKLVTIQSVLDNIKRDDDMDHPNVKQALETFTHIFMIAQKGWSPAKDESHDEDGLTFSNIVARTLTDTAVALILLGDEEMVDFAAEISAACHDQMQKIMIKKIQALDIPDAMKPIINKLHKALTSMEITSKDTRLKTDQEYDDEAINGRGMEILKELERTGK